MRVALRIDDRAQEKRRCRVRVSAPDRSIMWLYAAENHDGGIAAWKTPDGMWEKAYPEVTGYLLPTMLAHGADDLALRCAAWLVRVQNPNGSWNGIDGIQRPFDTAAIVEGLQATCLAYYDSVYLDVVRCQAAIEKAWSWMRSQISSAGYLFNSPSHPQPEIYNLRASAIIGNRAELDYWKATGLNHREQRSHYLAYALEGALNIDREDSWAIAQVEMAYNMQTGLMPFYVRPDWSSNHPAFDYCASAQMGILYQCVGLDARRVYRLMKDVIEPNGGIAQAKDDPRQIAWAVKFWLDFQKVMEQ